MTQADVQGAGGPSTATLRLIEGGKHKDFRDGTGSDLEKAIQWMPGSIDNVLAGGDPTPVRRPVAIHTRGGGVRAEIIQAVENAFSRGSADPDAEADRLARLLEGVQQAWKLAPLAAELGCHPAEIRDFTHAGFGLLIGSGVLALITPHQEVLAEVMADFTEADRWGAKPARGGVTEPDGASAASPAHTPAAKQPADDADPPDLADAARKLRPGERRAEPEQGEAGGEENQDLGDDHTA